MKKIENYEPTRFWELLAEYKDAHILKKLFELYPEEKRSRKGYILALKELRATKPINGHTTIIISKVKDGKTSYESVRGFDKGTRWAIEFNSWGRWLGYWVSLDDVWRVKELDFIAYCLWEMTFDGYSSKKIQRTWKKITTRAKEAKKELKIQDSK